MAGPASPSIAEKRGTWLTKPSLRAVYTDYFRRMAQRCRPGNVLEIGAGGAPLAEFLDGVVTLDIRHAPWVDVVGDAQALPFASTSFDNIVMLDVLHHLATPRRFFDEAVRILRPGGRIMLMEPAITPLSWPILKLFHHEAIDMGADPLGTAALSGGDPDDANQAVPTLLFGRRRDEFETAFPMLDVTRRSFLSLFAYPLTGGFRSWSVLPAALVPPLLALEDILLPVLGRFAAFRIFVTLELRP